MSDWIRREAAKIRELERNAGMHHGREMQRHERIDAHWASYWGAVVRAVRDNVAAFNAEFPRDSVEHLTLDTPTEHEVVVRRPGLPPLIPARIVRALVLPDEGIRVTLKEMTMESSGCSEHDVARLAFEVTADGAGIGVVVVGHVTDHLHAAYAILRPLFD